MRCHGRFLSLVLLTVSCVFTTVHSAWAGPYDSHVLLAPESTNLLVFVDAQGIYSTPLAKAEGLKDKVKDAFTSGQGLIPPNAYRMVMAAEVDPLDGYRPAWDISIIDLNKAPDVIAFARRERAPIEHLDGHRLIQSHTGMLILELKSPQHILTSSLASRQMFSRCLKGTAPGATSKLSPYLANLSAHLPDKAQIVIGLDLQQVFTPVVAQQILGKDASPRAVDALGTIQGLTCSVHVDEARYVAIRLDFADKIDGLGSEPYKAIQPVLKVLGFTEDNLQIIRPVGRAESHAITLRGELPPDRLRALFRNLESSGTQADFAQDHPTESAAHVDPMQLKILASKKYLASLESLLKELRENMRSDAIAAMSEKYARKIDGLPMLNVDPDLLTFSGNVSGSLRYQAQVRREAGLRTGVRMTLPTYESRSFYGPYGTYTAERQVNPNTFATEIQDNAPATQLRISEWRQIEDGMVKIKRTLTERYQAEF